MNERDLERRCMDVFRRELSGCYLWKIHDEVTGGQPDLEVNWRSATTKLEFKLLRENETVHDKWADGRQLMTCVRYERATGRCWIIAYRQGVASDRTAAETTLIYRPTGLLNGRVPQPEGFDQNNSMRFKLLWERGVIRLRGFDHKNVANLIRFTHR